MNLKMFTKMYVMSKTNYIRAKKMLEEYENLKYLEWKKENPSSRTAVDKVIAEIKVDDLKLQELEKTYQTLYLEYLKYQAFYEIMKGMVNNPSYTKQDVEEFLNGINELNEN